MSSGIEIKGTPVFERHWAAMNEVLDTVECSECGKVHSYGGRPKIVCDVCEVKVTFYKWRYIIHEGSSRSSKTVSLIDSCDLYSRQEEFCRVAIYRDTKIICKKTVYKSMLTHLKKTGRFSVGITENKSESILNYEETGSQVEIEGADEIDAHGREQTIAWLNEPYRITRDTFDQIDQRTEDFVFIDWNPRTSHWIDKLKKNPRALVIRSTFRDNPFCPPEQRRKILSYDPSVSSNVENGTADEYKWMVYGLGLKAEKPNKIYQNWTEVTADVFDKIPAQAYYGLDFGLNAPAALVACKYYDGKFCLKELFYHPVKDLDSYSKILEHCGVNAAEDYVICDSAGADEITALNWAGYNAIGAAKPAGSVLAGINFVQRFPVSYSGKNLDAEYWEYEWEMDRYNLPLDRPIKKNDHLLDASRYVMWWLNKYLDIALEFDRQYTYEDLEKILAGEDLDDETEKVEK